MTITLEPYDPSTSSSLPICETCGTQFPSARSTCFICDDPRQFVPPSGQTFTTHSALASNHSNEFLPYEADQRITFISTLPRFGIGQRAILIETPAGNILWDCITLLDDETARRVDAKGGLKAIVISHPHFYSAHVQWARRFKCPVYMAAEDREWTTMGSSQQVFLEETMTEIEGTGARAVKLGGHFPGSMVLWFDRRLFIADTLVTTPAGLGKWEVDAEGRERPRPEGLNTYSFLWSIPNMIPLGPEVVAGMWRTLKGFEFRATHGGFRGMDIEDEGVKGRVLQSIKIHVRAMGWTDHGILSETI